MDEKTTMIRPPYHHDPILRLDLASIGGFDLKGVQHKHVRQQVSRHRRTRDEQKIS